MDWARRLHRRGGHETSNDGIAPRTTHSRRKRIPATASIAASGCPLSTSRALRRAIDTVVPGPPRVRPPCTYATDVRNSSRAAMSAAAGALRWHGRGHGRQASDDRFAIGSLEIRAAIVLPAVSALERCGCGK